MLHTIALKYLSNLEIQSVDRECPTFKMISV